MPRAERPAVGIIPPLVDVDGLLIKETSASGGRFLELSLEFVASWGGPDDPPLMAYAVLDSRDVLVVVDALQGWLGSLGFAA